MKIGLLTYHSVPNFGANLQAYSTVSYLRSKGFDPVVINWIAKEIDESYGKDNPSEQVAAHKNFVKQNLPLTELCRTAEEVAAVIESEKIDKILIGSDIVLQHFPLLSRIKFSRKGIKIKPQRADTKFPNPFWGSFIPYLKEKREVSLMSAASQSLPYKLYRGKLRREMSKTLESLSYIFVRDESTRAMVKYVTRNKIVPDITPDPVFHFNQNAVDLPTKEEILKKYSLKDNYVLLSFRDEHVVSEEWLESTIELLRKEGKEGVLLAMPGGIVFNRLKTKTIGIPLDPIDWYSLIRHSSGYIGENMHPIVVALHNAVPFFAFDDYGKIKYKFKLIEHTSKIYSIVKISGFVKHRISTLGRKYVCPAPQSVVQLLTEFDIKRCEKFSLEQQEKYERMMNSILNT